MNIENLITALNGEIVTANFNSGDCKVKVQFNAASMPDFETGELKEAVLAYLTNHLS